MKQPTLWFIARVHGHDIPVILSTAKLTKVLKGCLGITIEHDSQVMIYLDATQPEHTQNWICWHELMVHGVLWARDGKPGFSECVAERLYDTGMPQRYAVQHSIAIEEMLAEHSSASAYDVARSFGFSWPARPNKGARA